MALSSILFACSGPEIRSEERRGQIVELSLPRLQGGEVSLAALRGRPILLTLFTTWDLRSQAEAPVIMQIRDRFAPHGLVVLGVALEPLGPRGLPLVRSYVEAMALSFEVLLAEPDDEQLRAALGPTRQVPRTVLLDRRGRVVLDQQGQTDLTLLLRLVEQVANER